MNSPFVGDMVSATVTDCMNMTCVYELGESAREIFLISVVIMTYFYRNHETRYA